MTVGLFWDNASAKKKKKKGPMTTLSDAIYRARKSAFLSFTYIAFLPLPGLFSPLSHITE